MQMKLYRGQRLRLKSPTIAVAPDNNNMKVAAIAPAGATVEIHEDVTGAAQLVPVTWDGKLCEMFSEDLRERGQLTTAAALSSSR